MSSLIVRHATEVTDCKGSSMFERDKKKVCKCTGQGDLAHQPLVTTVHIQLFSNCLIDCHVEIPESEHASKQAR